MKQIQAYIKKHKLNEVLRVLQQCRLISGLSVLDRQGFGRAMLDPGSSETDLYPGVKLEVFCPSEVAEEVAALIEKAAHTGLKGDGKIYLGPIDQAIRISTGERGEKAI